MEKKIISALKRAEVNDFYSVTIYNVDGNGNDAPGIMINHNYNGMYPDEHALKIHNIARDIARKYGLKADPRGSKTATLIYLK